MMMWMPSLLFLHRQSTRHREATCNRTSAGDRETSIKLGVNFAGRIEESDALTSQRKLLLSHELSCTILHLGSIHPSLTGKGAESQSPGMGARVCARVQCLSDDKEGGSDGPRHLQRMPRASSFGIRVAQFLPAWRSRGVGIRIAMPPLVLEP